MNGFRQLSIDIKQELVFKPQSKASRLVMLISLRASTVVVYASSSDTARPMI